MLSVSVMYTDEEYADIVFVYGFCDGNANAAAREYQRRYPQRRHPSHRVFTRTFQRLRQTGRVTIQNNGGAPPRHGYAHEEAIIDHVMDNPAVSTRRTAHRLRLTQNYVWRTIHREELHPYHLQPVQGLRPEDYAKRVRFCRWILDKIETRPDFLNVILWTDEAQFTRDGINNHHNDHRWSLDNPHSIRERRFQQRFSVNVWAGIFNGSLLPLYEIPHRMNGHHYREFLETHIDDMLDDLPLDVRRRMYYQHDGAPVHNAAAVTAWLNHVFRRRWIGSHGPIPWPPRSPDLSPLDFYVWGHLKQEVYRERIDTREQLQQRIHNAAHRITQNRNTLRNVYDSLLRRCNACIRVGGAHFEHVL